MDKMRVGLARVGEGVPRVSRSLHGQINTVCSVCAGVMHVGVYMNEEMLCYKTIHRR